MTRADYMRDYMRNYRVNNRGSRPAPVAPFAKKSHNHKSKWKYAQYIAWDGEGITLPDGTHIYTLLANSEGHYIWDNNGLSRKQCLDFLYSQYHRYPHGIHVWFSGDYDINMILQGLSKEEMSELNEGSYVIVDGFVVRYTPRHTFDLKLARQFGNRQESARFYDSWGFFQGSFINAIEEYFPNHPDLPIIKEGKENRSIFDVSDEDFIRKYCINECRLLVEMMEKLHKALDNTKYTPLSRYDGAGAVGTRMMQVEGIKESMADTPKQVQELARYAYYGGRNEITCIGNSEKRDVFAYDVNSAYPFSMLELPDLTKGIWRHTKLVSDIPAWPFTMVHIKWCFHRTDLPFYPLPWRDTDGSVLFPRQGEGWYWQPEIDVFLEYCAMFYIAQSEYELIESWEFETDFYTQPFAFVKDVYAQRREYKVNGDFTHMPLKLGLNSLYGKMAQQVGNHKPPYHQLEWAGYVTSLTRSLLLKAALLRPLDVLMFATDAIYSASKLPFTDSKDLGGWECDYYSGITIAQSGVYWLKKDGNWIGHSRGFGKGSVCRDYVLEGWNHNVLQLPIVLTRFITMKSVNAGLEPYENWRKWITKDRLLCITPTGKRILSGSIRGAHTKLIRTFARDIPLTAIISDEIMTNPHKIRGNGWAKVEDIIEQELEGTE